MVAFRHSDIPPLPLALERAVDDRLVDSQDDDVNREDEALDGSELDG